VGAEVTSLLQRYLTIVCEEGRRNPRIRSIAADDLRTKCGMSDAELTLLGHAVMLGIFHSGLSHADRSWVASVPSDLSRLVELEDLEQYIFDRSLALARPQAGSEGELLETGRNPAPRRGAGAEEAKRQAMNRDAVTTLWDRGTLDAELPRLVDEAQQLQRPLGLVMVDLDHFKRVNDQHLHQAGDAVLAAAAAVLSRCVEGRGSAYRYGGDEFILILANASPDESVALAERVRREIESMETQGIRITASIGVSGYPDHAQNHQELITAADAALRQGKDLGRNLVRVSGEAVASPGHEPPVRRKLPDPSRLTETQGREIRRRHLSGERVRCPLDQALLRVEEIWRLGSTTAELMVVCPACGLQEVLRAETR
jgi:diguanylate cyclase (GGDEF)-like protein